MQKKIIQLTSLVSGAILSGILSLPFLTHAEQLANLINNPGLETADPINATFPEQWSKGFWGTNDAVFTYPVLGPEGTKAAKVEITNYTNGDAKWFFADVPVRPKEQYVFSGNYSATVPADVVVRYTLLDGGYKYAYLGTSVTSPTWTGYSTLPFTVPEGAVSLTVFHLIHEAGSLSIDNDTLRAFVPGPNTIPATITPVSGGGVVPISFLTHALSNIPLPYNPFSNSVATPKINTRQDVGALPLLTATPPSSQAVNKKVSVPLFVRPAEAAVETPANFPPRIFSKGLAKEYGISPLGILASGFSDLTLAASGLMLIVFSLALTFLLTASENRKRERRTELWDM